MVTGVIKIFLVPGTRFCEGLAADTAAFSGECFSSLVWLWKQNKVSFESNTSFLRNLKIWGGKDCVLQPSPYAQPAPLSRKSEVLDVPSISSLQRKVFTSCKSLEDHSVGSPLCMSFPLEKEALCFPYFPEAHMTSCRDFLSAKRQRRGDEEQIIADQPTWLPLGCSV